MPEYSQGLCSDGAAILKDGQPLTIEQILEALRERDALSKKQGITLTASQLREALYWANPDNTPDEEDTEVRIEWMPKRKSTDGEDLAAGDYLYYIDCPEEGVIGPLGQDPIPAPAVLQTAPNIPEGYILMPASLTAENGDKYAMIGEFFESITLSCPDCDGDDTSDDHTCGTCGGGGDFEQKVPVTWSTIKNIYAFAVMRNAAPKPDHIVGANKKVCVMNCGPHIDDPRTDEERQSQCEDCQENGQ